MTPFDDLLLLRIFVRIVESGSISAAARTMKLPQPTLSRDLRVLEARCGGALLQRDTHRMSLTEKGHRMLEDARAMLELAESAAQRIHDDQATLRGHLRLFATVDSGQFTVSRLISRFLHEHPEVTAELSYSNRPQRMIEQGYDAGVVTGDITDENVVARSAGKTVRYLVASPKLISQRPGLKNPGDLESWPWVSLAAVQFGGAKSVSLTAPKQPEQTVQIKPVFISEGVTSLREAVRLGLGVAVLPDWLVRRDLQSGRLVRLLPQWSAKPFPIHVIYQGQRQLPSRVRAFVDFAATYMTTEIHADELIDVSITKFTA
jgi:DNA-binding transcriptional LysR family regulator